MSLSTACFSSGTSPPLSLYSPFLLTGVWYNELRTVDVPPRNRVFFFVCKDYASNAEYASVLVCCRHRRDCALISRSVAAEKVHGGPHILPFPPPLSSHFTRKKSEPIILKTSQYRVTPFLFAFHICFYYCRWPVFQNLVPEFSFAGQTKTHGASRFSFFEVLFLSKVIKKIFMFSVRQSSISAHSSDF